MSLTSTAVMQRRLAPAKGLDYFPTPPWATRVFMHEVLQADQNPAAFASIWEPACGEGHMAHVLAEFGDVHGSDVHDYGRGFEVCSFVGEGLDVARPRRVCWVITNPPFNLAEAFLERALECSVHGVALLLRTSWMEGIGRYDRVFSSRPPTLIAQYAERVPMVAGKWDPGASSATSYGWFVWHHVRAGGQTQLVWIKPGAKDRHHCASDMQRWST